MLRSTSPSSSPYQHGPANNTVVPSFAVITSSGTAELWSCENEGIESADKMQAQTGAASLPEASAPQPPEPEAQPVAILCRSLPRVRGENAAVDAFAHDALDAGEARPGAGA